jgi:hypothetical protein
MPSQESHLSDQELLLAADGELSEPDYGRVQSHLAACWSCRTRKQEIETAISEFVRIRGRDSEVQLPPPDGPRALLKARLAQLAETQRTSWAQWVRAAAWAVPAAMLALTCAVGGLAYLTFETSTGRSAEHMMAVSTPDPGLTPGATVLANRGEVCSESSAKNKAVPVSLQRRVFKEYGIRTAQPSAYEVDYLITPALGGADDIHNLWPQSKEATLWNAQVKDALEDHLRDLVCDGKLDLATAQREMATNWIEAYKKYFHTDRPLTSFR